MRLGPFDFGFWEVWFYGLIAGVIIGVMFQATFCQ